MLKAVIRKAYVIPTSNNNKKAAKKSYTPSDSNPYSNHYTSTPQTSYLSARPAFLKINTLFHKFSYTMSLSRIFLIKLKIGCQTAWAADGWLLFL